MATYESFYPFSETRIFCVFSYESKGWHSGGVRQRERNSKARHGVGSNQHAVKPKTRSRRSAVSAVGQARSLDEASGLEEIYQTKEQEARSTHQQNMERFSFENIKAQMGADPGQITRGPFVLVSWDDDTYLPYGNDDGYFVVDMRMMKEEASPSENFANAEGFFPDWDSAHISAREMHQEESNGK